MNNSLSHSLFYFLSVRFLAAIFKVIWNLRIMRESSEYQTKTKQNKTN